jgi:ferredoxin
MALSVSEDCIGCAACEGICSDVFEINGDGVAQVIEGADLAAHAEHIQEAIDSCPVSAISE